MPDIIEPRVLKGFRDSLPDSEMLRNEMTRSLESAFRSFGFVPIDTPVLEYADILLGKSGGETEKQIYRFKDNGGRDVAMRFDLTIPFARFMAEHLSELYLPFRRYHIAKAWRGENTQRGRYREFYQCDFDIVGIDSISADLEIAELIASSMTALGVEAFTIKINHRGIFNRFLERIGASSSSIEVLRTVDRLDKVGADETRTSLGAIVGETAGDIIDYIAAGPSFSETLDKMERLAGGHEADTDRMRRFNDFALESGLARKVKLDPSIMRGHDYYTGIVYETYLDAIPEIGQICGGGRYNDLASLYTKQCLPGVGASIGLDRLIAGLEALGTSRAKSPSCAVLILNLEDESCGKYHTMAAAFRSAGVSAEVFPEKKKIGAQFAYAERKGIPFGLVFGAEERAKGRIVVKDLASRESVDYATMEEAALAVGARLRG